MDSHSKVTQVATVIDEIIAGVTSTREVIRSLKDNPTSLDFKNGVSLLSLKHHLLLSYLNSLVLISSRRAIGHSLSARSQPCEKFSIPERSTRGGGPGDLVDYMVEGRIVLEKIRTLESRMRYQIEKLVKAAQEPEKIHADSVHDPLAFRPNPHNLVDSRVHPNATEASQDDFSRHRRRDYSNDVSDGLYHPPRVAPVPYIEKSSSRSRKERRPLPSALTSLPVDPLRPHMESTSGLGSTPSLTSGRAAYLKRLNEFEEENFQRIVMKKSDARRRVRDEEDLALGGRLLVEGNRNRRRAGGLEDEFSDVLKSVGRVGRRGPVGERGDGYDELRQLSKKGDVLQRSRQASSHKRAIPRDDGDPPERTKKRSRFELETKKAKKKLRNGSK